MSFTPEEIAAVAGWLDPGHKKERAVGDLSRFLETDPTSAISKRQSDLFKSAADPPRGLIEPRTKFEMSTLEKLLKRLTDLDPAVYVRLANFADSRRRFLFLPAFLERLKVKDLEMVAKSIRPCDCTFRFFAERLRRSDTFLLAFKFLFKRFSEMSAEMRAFVGRCFRASIRELSLGHVKDALAEVGSCSFEAMDLVFTALVDECGKKDYGRFRSESVHIPFSLLKMAKKNMVKVDLNVGQMWASYVTSPYETQAIIGVNPLEVLLDRINPLQCVPANVWYYADLLLACMRWLLKKDDSSSPWGDFRDLMRYWLTANGANQNLMRKRIVFFALYMAFCWLSEQLAMKLQKDELDEIIESVICTTSYEDLVIVCLWTLYPTKVFPFNGNGQIVGTESIYFPSPSYTFTRTIAPKIIVSVLREGAMKYSDNASFSQFISHVRHLYTDVYTSPLLMIDDADVPDLLSALRAHFDKPEVFDFLVHWTQVSCDYRVFSWIYQRIGNDIPKTLEFLCSVAEGCSLVTDFLSISSRNAMNINFTTGTIAMWVRCPTGCHFMSLKPYNDETLFPICIDSTKIRDTICGWRFVCIDYDGDSVSVYVNTCKATCRKIKGPFSVTIGTDEVGAFELQSFRIFRPRLEACDMISLFFLGPNFKENILADFVTMSLHDQHLTFCDPLYCSSLYWRSFWSEWMTMDPERATRLFAEHEVTSIAPPFVNVAYQNRRRSKTDLNSQAPNKWCIPSFLNVLDLHGGVSLLIHLFTEALIGGAELQRLGFRLLDIVLRKFPSVHFYFVKNRVYKSLARLVSEFVQDHQLIMDLCISEPELPNTHTVKLNGPMPIFNVHVLKYWLLIPSTLQSVSCEQLRKLADVVAQLERNARVESLNNKIQLMLRHAKAFKRAAASLSVCSDSQRLQPLKTLVEKLWEISPGSAKESIAYVKELLLTDHFGNPKANHEATAALIDILRHCLAAQDIDGISMNVLAPMMEGADVVVQEKLYQLFLETRDSFEGIYAALCSLSTSPDLASRVYKLAEDSWVNTGRLDKASYLTMPLIFLVSKPEYAEEFTALAKASVTIEQVSDYFVLFEGILFLLQELFKESHPIAQGIREARDHKSIEITGIFQAIATLIVKICLAKPIVLDSFCSWMKSMPSEDTLYCLYALLNNIPENEDVSKAETFIAWCVNTALPLITGSDSPAVKELSRKIDSEYEEAKKKYDLQDSIILKRIDAKLKDSKTHQERQEPRSESEIASNQDPPRSVEQVANDTFLEAVHNRTLALQKRSLHGSNSGAIELWTRIFSTLHFPASMVFTQCHPKYKVDDKTMLAETRKLLFPINPAIETDMYCKRWTVKYGDEEPPVIRMTMKSVIKGTSPGCGRKLTFSARAARISGISTINGILLIQDKKIKFCRPDEVITFHASEVSCVRLTSFQQQETGIFIETSTEQRWLFSFETPFCRAEFLKAVSKLSVKVHRSMFDSLELNTLTEQWRKGRISNFHYLLKLNFLSGRLWSDFTQFPIFPWTKRKYDDESWDNNDKWPESRRILERPFFAQTDEQMDACRKYYELTMNLEGQPHHFTNYISNLSSALYFLVRTEPVTNEEIEFQGGRLDVADRTFQSFRITSEVMGLANTKSTLELIPEAYFMPEFLTNFNSVIFPRQPGGGDVDISKVALPKGEKPEGFILKMRKILESEAVSQSLHLWIDLIWGIRATGNLAKEVCNVFQVVKLVDDADDGCEDWKLLDARKEQIHSCGQAPTALFKEAHPKRDVVVRERTVSLESTSVKDTSLFREHVPLAKIHDTRLMLRNPEMRLTFAGDIKPTKCVCSGKEIVTAHSIPLINHWSFRDNRPTLLQTLRGEPSEVTSLDFSKHCGVILSGHRNGRVSVFSVRPHCLLRVVQCREPQPVTKVLLIGDNFGFATLQQYDSSRFRLSLFYINGNFRMNQDVPGQALSWAVTHFTDGLTDDHLFILTDSDTTPPERHILDINVVTMSPGKDIVVNSAADRIQLLTDNVLVLLHGNSPVEQYIFSHNK